MSHDNLGLHEAVERLNGFATMLLETGRSTPVGALVGSVSRLTKSPKPTAGLGWGIVVGAAAVLAISAIRKNRPSAVPAAGHAEPRAPVAPGMTAAGATAVTSPPAGEEQGTEAATATAAAESTAPAAPAKTPRRKSGRKPAGGTP